MNSLSRSRFTSLALAVAASAAVALAGCAEMKSMLPGMMKTVTLTGAQEVPPVQTSASGTMRYRVEDDRTVSGSVETTGITATAAHIHEGAAGKNGPIIVPLSRTSGSTWVVPSGSKLTESQHRSYKAGELYVNVHSDANKGGEIRAQLKP